MVRRKPPLETVAPQEAFQELLRGSAVYGEDTATAPYREGLVSLPESVAGSPHVADLLPPDDRKFVVGFAEQVLLPECEYEQVVQEEGVSNVPVDPVLRSKPRVYARFLWRLRHIGLLRWGTSSKCGCCVFL